MKGLTLGYVEFSGIGGFQESFVSELLDSGIKLRRVTVSGGRITGAVSPLCYRKAAVTAKKHGVKLRAGRRGGLYFTALKYSKRAGLYAGLMLFFLIISLGKSTVADIRITGDAPKAQVMDILERCGITKGVSRSGLNLSLAEQKIMLEVKNTAWVDVSCVGCRVIVDVHSGTEAPDIYDPTAPCNIVAARDAQIIETTVRKGRLAAEKGSGIQKGGLLVSGTVPDGSGRILYLHSSAEIIGEFTQTEEFYVPYSETVKLPNGEKTEYKYLVIGDDVYPLFWGEAYAADSLYSEQTEKLAVFGMETPMRLITGTFTKYTYVDIARSDDDCIYEFKKRKADYEENFLSDYEIVSAVEKCTPEEGGIRFAVEYTLRGNIAEEQPIEAALGNMGV